MSYKFPTRGMCFKTQRFLESLLKNCDSTDWNTEHSCVLLSSFCFVGRGLSIPLWKIVILQFYSAKDIILNLQHLSTTIADYSCLSLVLGMCGQEWLPALPIWELPFFYLHHRSDVCRQLPFLPVLYWRKVAKYEPMRQTTKPQMKVKQRLATLDRWESQSPAKFTIRGNWFVGKHAKNLWENEANTGISKSTSTSYFL